MRRSISPIERWRGIGLIAAAIPIAVAQLARVVDRFGPAPASASTAVGEVSIFTPAPTPPAEPTPGQAAALAWLRAQESVPWTGDPFATQVAPAHTEPVPIKDVVPAASAPTDAQAKPPEIKVSGFMGKGDSAMVTLNRRVRRVGDEIASGWTLIEIDPIARRVRLRHSSGVVAEVQAGGK
jgi:hypothetical protein